jgi:hypothetical protein
VPAGSRIGCSINHHDRTLRMPIRVRQITLSLSRPD